MNRPFPRHGKQFSTLWKISPRIFHAVENFTSSFPCCGKKFSTLWKRFAPVFHAVEKGSRFFPRCGKCVSTAWKTRPRRFPWNLNIDDRISFSSRLRPAARLLLFALALPASAQLGPFTIETRQATFNAELVKREQDIVWVRRQASDGRYMPQAGLAAADIRGIRMPRPPVLTAADRMLAAPAVTDAQYAEAHRALDRLILQTRPFRDIPGIHAEEAILLKGRLLDRQGRWRDAVRQYENILSHAKPSAHTTHAQIRAGIAYARLEEYQFAAEYLVDMPWQEHDEELLSAQLFALGDSYLALDNPDQALMTYLSLVVFYPYVQFNEARALAAALRCYARLQEWEPFHRTVQDIQRMYPNTPAAKAADEMLATHRADLVKAGLLADSRPAPTGTPTPDPEPEYDIEYPEGI